MCPSAKVDFNPDDYVEDVDEVAYAAVFIGDPIEGEIVVAHHECPRCHSKMDTIGIGVIECTCGPCVALRGVKVKMNCRIERLTDDR